MFTLSSVDGHELFPNFGYYEQCHDEHFCTSFCVDVFSFFSSIYLRVKLRHVVTPCLTLQGTARLLTEVPTPFYISSSKAYEGSNSSTPFPTPVTVCKSFSFFKLSDESFELFPQKNAYTLHFTDNFWTSWRWNESRAEKHY